jgi:glycosyltransferase involved in cell wall biosynthesis
MDPRETKTAPLILCLLWRPSGSVVRDGGFRRTYSILESLPSGSRLTLLDRHPTLISDEGRCRVVEYRLPRWLIAWRDTGSNVAGFVEAVFVFILLVVLGAKELYGQVNRVVYVPTSEIPWVTASGYLLSRLFDCRLVLVNLNAQLEVARMAGGLVGRLLWVAHANSDQVIAVSAAIAEQLSTLGVRANVSVNTCGFTPPPYDWTPPIPERHGAAYVGRVEKPKGMNDLLDVWAQVTRALPSVHLRVIGYASPKNRMTFVERRENLGLEHAIDLLGVVPDAAKWKLLNESRVCLFLSHAEGWGYVPLEALYLGVPVVVYDLPCYLESLRDQQGVFRVPVGNIAAAAEHVVRLLSMAAQDYMALADRIRLSFHYSDWPIVARAELALIKGVEQG